jgi:hypothetical protein
MLLATRALLRCKTEYSLQSGTSDDSILFHHLGLVLRPAYGPCISFHLIQGAHGVLQQAVCTYLLHQFDLFLKAF